jgi:hypothetical protein
MTFYKLQVQINGKPYEHVYDSLAAALAYLNTISKDDNCECLLLEQIPNNSPNGTN